METEYATIKSNRDSHRRRFLDSLTIAHQIVDVLDENKAENIVLLDLRPDTVIADFFVICTATSDRQVRALVDYVRENLREEFGKSPYSSEGTPESGWQLLDYGDVVVHIFQAEQRRYYDLEGLWHQANVMVKIQ